MWRCLFNGLYHFVFTHQQNLYSAVLSSVLMWRLNVVKILKLIIFPLCPYCFSLYLLFLLITSYFWRSSLSLHAFPVPWIFDVFMSIPFLPAYGFLFFMLFQAQHWSIRMDLYSHTKFSPVRASTCSAINRKVIDPEGTWYIFHKCSIWSHGF